MMRNSGQFSRLVPQLYQLTNAQTNHYHPLFRCTFKYVHALRHINAHTHAFTCVFIFLHITFRYISTTTRARAIKAARSGKFINFCRHKSSELWSSAPCLSRPRLTSSQQQQQQQQRSSSNGAVMAERNVCILCTRVRSSWWNTESVSPYAFSCCWWHFDAFTPSVCMYYIKRLHRNVCEEPLHSRRRRAHSHFI